MNHSLQTRHSPRLLKIESPYPTPLNQITPKKLFSDPYPSHPTSQSTLQKHPIFSSDHIFQAPQTLRKDRKKPKRPWTFEEDSLLKELVDSKGAKEWAFISSYFQDRCGKQCRERWHNHLRSGIKKGDWNHDEEWFLFLGVHAYGKRWSLISKYLEGRTENSLKNHWNCKMKPKKENLSKKLNRVMMSEFMGNSKKETHLLRLIREGSCNNKEDDLENESENTKMTIQLFKGVIDNFLEMKRIVYTSYGTETKTEEVKIEAQELVYYEDGQGRSEKKKERREKMWREEKGMEEMKLECLGIEHEATFLQSCTFGVINDFGSDSNSFNLKMNGVMKEVSEFGDFRKEDEFEMKESEWSKNEMGVEESFENEGDCSSFRSPERRRIFEGMDLEASIKKKLFESEEKK